jgi:hypothetical protein
MQRRGDSKPRQSNTIRGYFKRCLHNVLVRTGKSSEPVESVLRKIGRLQHRLFAKLLKIHRNEFLRRNIEKTLPAWPNTFFHADTTTMKQKKQLADKIRKSVDAYIREAEQTKREFTSNERTGPRTPAAIAIKHFRPLNLDCAITKDHAFHEEQEWRLVFRLLNQSIEDVFFRVGGSMLVPYLKIPLAFENRRAEIKRIYVGPSPNLTGARESLEMLLRKHDIHGVEVIPSKIPYRNW